MDIRSFGEANVRRFYELGFLKDIPGVYTLPWDEIRKMDGFEKSRLPNCNKPLKTQRNNPCTASSMRWAYVIVGETTAKTLANAVEHLLQFIDYRKSNYSNWKM